MLWNRCKIYAFHKIQTSAQKHRNTKLSYLEFTLSEWMPKCLLLGRATYASILSFCLLCSIWVGWSKRASDLNSPTEYKIFSRKVGELAGWRKLIHRWFIGEIKLDWIYISCSGQSSQHSGFDLLVLFANTFFLKFMQKILDQISLLDFYLNSLVEFILAVLVSVFLALFSIFRVWLWNKILSIFLGWISDKILCVFITINFIPFLRESHSLPFGGFLFHLLAGFISISCQDLYKYLFWTWLDLYVIGRISSSAFVSIFCCWCQRHKKLIKSANIN